MNSTTTAAVHNSELGSQKRSWRAWWRSVRLPLLILGLFAWLIMSFAYYQATYVSGREFNTATWEIREFAFRRDPFTNFQLGGIRHSAPSYSLAWSPSPTGTTAEVDPTIKRYLKTSTQVTTPADPGRWDLLELNHGMHATGAASILYELVAAPNVAYDAYWPAWNLDNPKKAARLWPAVHDLLPFGLYAELPALFELTQLGAKPAEFERQLNQQMIASLVKYAQQQADLGRLREAQQAAQVGLKYGGSPELDPWLKAGAGDR